MEGNALVYILKMERLPREAARWDNQSLGVWTTITSLSEKKEWAQTCSPFLGQISGHICESQVSLGEENPCLSLLSLLPILLSHQHEIIRELNRTLGILGKQKTKSNSLKMKMCKEVEDIFHDVVEYFFTRESFQFSHPFASTACLQPKLIWP